MNMQRVVSLLLMFLLGSPAVALDATTCNAAAKTIDDRIAAGNHPPQNIAVATQLRDGIMQSCPFLDEPTLGQMMEGLDQLLPSGAGGKIAPAKNASEREAEREAQRAEANRRQAEREKRRAAQRAREEAEQNLVSDAVRKPPTGRSVKGQLVSRPDAMWRASMLDWDIYEGGARLLYETGPSREQGRLPDAARHYYVVEFDTSNHITQHHVLETTLNRVVAAGLVRNRDEIIIQWHEYESDVPKPVESHLERWSISGARMLSRAQAPRMRGPGGTLGPDNHFQLVTAGNGLFFARSVALEPGPTPKFGVSWMLTSLDGDVRDRSLIVHESESLSSSDWFHSVDGGAGLILDVQGIGENGIDSQLRPDALRIGSADIRPVVNAERRLYVAGGAETGAALPAFERTFLWQGLENVDQAIMISGESTRLIDETEGKYRVRDSAVSLAVTGRYRLALTLTRDGHAILIMNNHRDRDFPPTRGLWLQEFATRATRRDTYLNPDAEHLGAQFNMLASDGDDNLYVASRQFILQLDGAREVTAYARSAATDAEVRAMAVDGNNVWLFGEHHGNRVSHQQMWIERIQF